MYHPQDGQREAPPSNRLPHDGQLSGFTLVAILQGVATGTGILVLVVIARAVMRPLGLQRFEILDQVGHLRFPQTE